MSVCECVTAGFGVSVVVDDEVELLTWVEQSAPRQRRGVAQLGVVVYEHEAAANAPQRTQTERFDVERLHSQREHTPMSTERRRKETFTSV